MNETTITGTEMVYLRLCPRKLWLFHHGIRPELENQNVQLGLLIVYDTERKNCAKLHKFLKGYLNWNQRSVFEGTVTEAQYQRIKQTIDEIRAEDSHVVFYSMENEKLLHREELGEGTGNVSNIL